jgi:hypothetical protein
MTQAMTMTQRDRRLAIARSGLLKLRADTEVSHGT